MSEKCLFEGSCHCGAVRLRVRAALDARVDDCNCSICRKKGFLHLIVPPEDFELLSGEQELSTYRFGTGVARHHFCRHCGIHPFYRPRSHPDWYDINVRCLEGNTASFVVVPFDGQHWEQNVASLPGAVLPNQEAPSGPTLVE